MKLLTRITKQICREYQVSPSDLYSGTRKVPFPEVRRKIAFTALTDGHRNGQIAKHLRRDHTTVSWMIQKHIGKI